MKRSVFCLGLTLSLLSAHAEGYRTVRQTDTAGYTYETVVGDPTQTRMYTLGNGLTVFLSRNATKPRIQTYIPVRTGSNNDPSDNTGLAHYLEHMLFKGTSRMGSLDWERERVELQKISDLYERHKATHDPAERQHLYRQIDSISQIAAQYVAANEYDRLTTAIGAQGTNAHTYVEETVYKNNIPANELERWLQIESERMGELTLRLFHTEIEAVYEEFNMGQDRVYNRVFEELHKALYPGHPLGTQTTIGTGEHLKTPSLRAIHQYFDRYYTPTNYAIVLVGDLEYEPTIKLVDRYFGTKPSHPVEQPKFAPAGRIDGPVVREVVSPDEEQLFFAYRFDEGAGSDTDIYVQLVDMILTNGKAGLIDLNLNQTLAVQYAGCSPQAHTHYTEHLFYGAPKDGQSLEETRDLILGQIERVKAGDFPDWLLEAVVNDLELQEMRALVDADKVATAIYSAYIHGESLETRASRLARMRRVTKSELVDFARKHYGKDYVIVFKRKGENAELVRVENPGITPLTIDRNAMSQWGKDLLSHEAPRLSPQWVDYKQAIKRIKVAGQEVEYIVNDENDLFELWYVVDMGQNHDRKLRLAFDYLGLLGAGSLSAQALQQELYKLGVSVNFVVGPVGMTIRLSGLSRSLESGVKLLNSYLSQPVADEAALEALKARILKDRKEAKSDKGRIFDELRSMAVYGEDTPTRRELSRAELEALTSGELLDIVRRTLSHKHRVFYYGAHLDDLKRVLKETHRPGKLALPAEHRTKQIPTGGKVLYADYDMVQTQLMMLRRVSVFDAREAALERLFNAYFGGGMGSIVFQEIREAKSLAYSAYAYYGGARNAGDYQYVTAFVGTQANKLPEALVAMEALISDMPESRESFETAKESALREIEAGRIMRTQIFVQRENLRRLGIEEDIRKRVYSELKTLTLADLKAYFERVIKGNDYTYILIGRASDLPLELMGKYGEVQQVDLNYLFGNEE